MLAAILVGMVGLANGQVGETRGPNTPEVMVLTADMKIVKVAGTWLGSRHIQIYEMQMLGSNKASSFVVSIPANDPVGSIENHIFEVTKITRDRCGGIKYETVYVPNGLAGLGTSFQLHHQEHFGCANPKTATWSATLRFRGRHGATLTLEGEPVGLPHSINQDFQE